MPVQAVPAFVSRLAAAQEQWDANKNTDRLWAKDASLWPGGDAANWLGWLDTAEAEDASLDAFAAQVRALTPRDTSDVLLLGMGGSSLAAEVIARTVPKGANGATIRVLDSTHPTSVAEAFEKTDWWRTLVLVASKSGSTLEPDILLTAAMQWSKEKIGPEAPKRVIAITDPGSKLIERGEQLGIAGFIGGKPTIGGRYSALSPFGLTPAVLHGLDLKEFARSGREMAAQCKQNGAENPGVSLGIFMGEAARTGRNKLTLVLPPTLAALGGWIEQLVAESTGKNGTAIIPIDGESIRPPAMYGADRVFVHIRDASAGTDGNQTMMPPLAAAGHPVYTIDVPSPKEIAGEFFRWEIATAVAGSLMSVNPFDQPDVEAAKIATRKITDEFEKGGGAPALRSASPMELKEVLSSIKPGDYAAILAFMPALPNVVRSLQRVRHRIRDAKKVATILGFGPRFLHSTGQAFKGGPNTGVFVQLTCDFAKDVVVPGRHLPFGTVCNAQAAGDLQILLERGRRAIHIHLRGDLNAALAAFDSQVTSALT